MSEDSGEAKQAILTLQEVEANPSILRNPNVREKTRRKDGQGHSKSNQAASGKAKNKTEPFVKLRLSMMTSVAWRALKDVEIRMLHLIEIEHMQHGGADNGKLVVSRRQFEEKGIWRAAIAPGLRALKAMGFVEIHQGVPGIGDKGQPHRFRLTYVEPNPTDEWKRHWDPDRTALWAETARSNKRALATRLGLRGAAKRAAENGFDGHGYETVVVTDTRPVDAISEDGEILPDTFSATNSAVISEDIQHPPVTDSIPLSISPQGGAASVWTKPVIRQLACGIQKPDGRIIWTIAA